MSNVKMHDLRAVVFMAAAAALAASSWAQSSPVYTVQSLPLSAVSAFNDQGQVLGRGFLPCSGLCTLSDSAVLYDSRTGTLTGLSGSFGAGAVYGALDAQGRLGGSQTTRDGTGALVRSVVVRQPDGTTATSAAPLLDATLGFPLQVRAFHANGQMLLQHTDGLDQIATQCVPYQAWRGPVGGPWQALGTAAQRVSMSGMNAAGVAVGAAVAAASCGGEGGGYKAVAASAAGTLIDLHGSRPGAFSRASAVNDLGYAVGHADSGQRTAPDVYAPQGRPILRAMVWNTATRSATDLGPAGALSRLNGVNNRGEVVGVTVAPMLAGQPVATTTSTAVIGNLATDGLLTDLNRLLANNTAGWVLQEAIAINAAGQIVARGTSAAGSGYALLTPTQTPYDPYAVVPTAPASLLVTLPASRQARLQWVNTARNATQLRVERCRGSRCTDFAAVAVLNGEATTWLDTTVASRTTYRWRLRAGNAAGWSAPGNIATATTLR